MLTAMMPWMLAVFLLGLATGLRSMTPMAVLCWFSYLAFLPVGGSWAAWTAGRPAVVIFTVLAIGELIVDKLPRTPNRIAAGPLLVRLVLGGLVGSITATAISTPAPMSVLLGVAGAIIGAFAGFIIRRSIVEKLAFPDWVIALGEDGFTLACAAISLHTLTR
jgi:uncharacterized membrane protein